MFDRNDIHNLAGMSKYRPAVALTLEIDVNVAVGQWSPGEGTRYEFMIARTSPAQSRFMGMCHEPGWLVATGSDGFEGYPVSGHDHLIHTSYLHGRFPQMHLSRQLALAVISNVLLPNLSTDYGREVFAEIVQLYNIDLVREQEAKI